MDTQQPERVLLVDDDESVRAAFQRTLERAGFATDVAPDCWSAMKMCRRATYGVIALDYNMPTMTGFDVHRELSYLQPDASFGLISAACTVEMAKDATNEYNFVFVLTKPWRMDELCSVVRRAMEASWERAATRKLQQNAVGTARRAAGPSDLPAFEHVTELISAILEARAPEALPRGARLREVALLIAAALDLPSHVYDSLGVAAYVRGVTSSAVTWQTEQGRKVSEGATLERVLRVLPRIEKGESGSILSELGAHWDGQGTPRGLRGERIHRGARVLAVADAFDMAVATLDVSLGTEHEVRRAVELVATRSGTRFDPVVVRALESLPTVALARVVQSNPESIPLDRPLCA